MAKFNIHTILLATYLAGGTVSFGPIWHDMPEKVKADWHALDVRAMGSAFGAMLWPLYWSVRLSR